MTRLVFDLAARELDFKGKITSLNPIRPENRPDAWEATALKSFEKGEAEFSTIEKIDSVDYLRLIRPLKVEKECLKCHEKQGYKYGDVRGGISVAVPMEPLRAIARKNAIISAMSYSLLWIAGLSGIFVGAARLRRVISQRDKAGEEIIALNSGLMMKTAALETANRELDAFCATVSHDLRSPLAVISSYSQLMQELPSESHTDRCGEFSRIIHEQALRMDALIETLLEFSRLSRIALRLKQVNLSDLAREISADLRQRDPQRTVDLSIDPALTATGDPQLLRLVLQNLLENSWKYTAKRAEGVIEFGATQRQGERVFFVRDNGVGFAMTQASQMFEPFQRLPGTEDFKGSGVGLATVNRIIERHGGRIWAEGEEGVGAIFYFTLPQSLEEG
jgi:signal transduction histidine kinase